MYHEVTGLDTLEPVQRMGETRVDILLPEVISFGFWRETKFERLNTRETQLFSSDE